MYKTILYILGKSCKSCLKNSDTNQSATSLIWSLKNSDSCYFLELEADL